jgi:hypothetical protein
LDSLPIPKGRANPDQKYPFWEIYNPVKKYYFLGIGEFPESVSVPKQSIFPFYNTFAMDKSAVYRIKMRGALPKSRVDRLGGMQIVAITTATTTLEGRLPDQAALMGVLDTLYELHLPLLEIIHLPHRE